MESKTPIPGITASNAKIMVANQAVALARPKQLTSEEIVSSVMEIPSLLDTKLDEVEHAIIYGETGSGKTTLAALLSEFFNILWLDGDKGLTAAVNSCHPEMLKRIRTVRIPDNPDYPTMVSTILRLIRGTQQELCLAHGVVGCTVCKNTEGAQVFKIALNQLPRNWIVIMDSQTQFYASVLAFSYYKDTGKMIGTGVPEEYRGNWDYRGIAYNCCDQFGNYLKDLKCQWVSISHELMNEMEDGTKKLVPIGGSANVSANYAKWFGSEIYAKKSVNKITYISSSTHSGQHQAKSRSNVALEKMEVPSLLHIFRPQEAEQLLKGSYNEWYLKEGWKPKGERTKGKENPPQPKEILPI